MSPILERIYGLMAERRMNAKYVSETLHLSNSSFTDWKKGKGNPNVEALTKMAEFFGVSLDYLILGKEPSPALPSHLPDDLDFSSQLDRDLYDKFHRLPAEFQGKVMAYLDGMLAVLPAPAQSAENTACKPRSDVDRAPQSTQTLEIPSENRNLIEDAESAVKALFPPSQDLLPVEGAEKSA